MPGQSRGGSLLRGRRQLRPISPSPGLAAQIPHLYLLACVPAERKPSVQGTGYASLAQGPAAGPDVPAPN